MSERNVSTPDIKKQVVFNATIEKVWEAVATKEGIESWFMPNDFTPELGTEFTIQSPFGPSPCKVIELDPPKRLVFSWGAGWEILFELKDLGNQTEFTLIHSGWGAADEVTPGGPGRTNLENRNTMDNGWDSIVNERLRKVVEQ